MLPTEAFADAVAYLRLFDLKALVVSNAKCSSVAVKASTRMRWEEFPGFRFCIWNQWIQIFRGETLLVASLTFPSENDMIDFVAAAFPNCVFEDLDIFACLSKHVLGVLGRVADSVSVTRVFGQYGMGPNDDSLKIARKFRKVKTLRLTGLVRDGEVDHIANVYRGSGIQELIYYRSNSDPTPQKFALF